MPASDATESMRERRSRETRRRGTSTGRSIRSGVRLDERILNVEDALGKGMRNCPRTKVSTMCPAVQTSLLGLVKPAQLLRCEFGSSCAVDRAPLFVAPGDECLSVN